MRAYLVDDEPLALRRLTRLLGERRDVEVAGSSTDPAAAVAEIRRLRPDVLFLDIEMPGLSAFDLLQSLGAPHVPVIFTTAHDRYALEAFAVDSIDYLLKPIEARELARALGKLTRLAGGGRRDLSDTLEQMRSLLAQPSPEHLTRLASRTGDRVEIVHVSDVTYFYAKDKLTFAVTRHKHHAIDPSIAELEQRLPPRRWLRIHRATLVSLDAVKELHAWFGRRLLLRMQDGTELHVARDRAAEVRATLGL